jgi:hypothetical protein
MTAQNILLNVLGVQDERFKVPGSREQIQQCMQDFIEMHGKAEQKYFSSRFLKRIFQPTNRQARCGCESVGLIGS